MNIRKVAKSIPLGCALLALSFGAIAEYGKKQGSNYAPPPMDVPFTSATTSQVTNGPLASDLALAERKARSECSNRLIGPLIDGCVRSIQEKQSRAYWQSK